MMALQNHLLPSKLIVLVARTVDMDAVELLRMLVAEAELLLGERAEVMICHRPMRC
jgi:hypothetical protein